ncbi:DUF202 domain-containing protein [Nocardia sp. NPDC003482]
MIADRGLQAERTALSWLRTAVAAMANALLLVRTALVADRPPAAVLALAGAAALGIVTAIALRRNRILHNRRGRWTDGRRAVALVAWTIAAVAVCALVVGWSWA